jgi:hypothetical protein
MKQETDNPNPSPIQEPSSDSEEGSVYCDPTLGLYLPTDEACKYCFESARRMCQAFKMKKNREGLP